MALLSSTYYKQWNLLDLRANPDTASGCATLDFTVFWSYEIVVQDVHGHTLEELSSTQPIPLRHLSLPITQSPTPGGFGRTILENLDKGLGMDFDASVDLLRKILGARNRAVGEHATTGFYMEVDLELATTSEVVSSDDDDDQEPRRPRGASEATKQKLDAESFVLEAGDQEAGTCAICLEDLSSGRDDNNRGRLTKMPCAHVFHKPCVLRWLDTSATCPMCRRELED